MKSKFDLYITSPTPVCIARNISETKANALCNEFKTTAAITDVEIAGGDPPATRILPIRGKVDKELQNILNADDLEELRKLACCIEMLRDICSKTELCQDQLEAFAGLLNKQTWDFYHDLDDRMKGGAA
jgi:hypothetical protein